MIITIELTGITKINILHIFPERLLQAIKIIKKLIINLYDQNSLENIRMHSELDKN